MRVWKTGTWNRRARRLPARSPITGGHANGHEKSRDAGGLSAKCPGFHTRIADVQRQHQHRPRASSTSRTCTIDAGGAIYPKPIQLCHRNAPERRCARHGFFLID